MPTLPILGVVHKVIHKYLQQRGNTYYFRWRIPADLRSVFRATELTYSLRTSDRLQASVRAGRFVLAVAGIKRARQAYLALELDFDEYVSELKQHWMKVRSMARRKTKTYKTELITAGGMVFDYGDDVDKELTAVSKAQEMGIIPKDAEPMESGDSAGILFSELFESFLAHKMDKTEAQKESRNPLNEKIQKEYRRYFNGLLEIMGDDAPISTIKRKALKNAILT